MNWSLGVSLTMRNLLMNHVRTRTPAREWAEEGQAVREAPPSKPIQLTQSLGPSAQELQITQPKTLVGL